MQDAKLIKRGHVGDGLQVETDIHARERRSRRNVRDLKRITVAKRHRARLICVEVLVSCRSTATRIGKCYVCITQMVLKISTAGSGCLAHAAHALGDN